MSGVRFVIPTLPKAGRNPFQGIKLSRVNKSEVGFMKFFSKFYHHSGFTLVELLIAMGLLSILLVVFTSIFAETLAMQLRSETISNLQTDGQFISARLLHDFNQATAVTTP